MSERSLTVVLAVAMAMTAAANAQEAGPLFPTAFAVEHAVVQTSADGSVFATEPVIDTYAASWIVSERTDGSRLVIDFARREITEIRPAEGRYTVIGFDRMAQLLRELNALEGVPTLKDKSLADVDGEPGLRVVELGASDAPAAKSRALEGSLVDREGVRHLRVVVAGGEKRSGGALLDAWFDPELRFSRRALDALEEFEYEVLGAAAGAAASLGQRSAALARREAGGALPILTVRPLISGDASAGEVEDAARRVEVLENVRLDLVAVPDGLRRTPHPLEMMVAHAEREAELRSLMGGGSR
jgi:hypothetical protein